MKLLVIFAAPFLIDAGVPVVLDASGHGIVNAVPQMDNSGGTCAFVDQNGNRDCGGGIDAMYFQKNTRAVDATSQAKTLNIQTLQPPNQSTQTPEQRARCSTISCAFPLVVDHSKDEDLCAGEVCDETGEDNENCCEPISTPADDVLVVAEGPDNSSQEEKKDELEKFFRLCDVNVDLELDTEELHACMFSQNEMENAHSNGMNVSANSLGVSRAEAQAFLEKNSNRLENNNMTLTIDEWLATLYDDENASTAGTALVQAQTTRVIDQCISKFWSVLTGPWCSYSREDETCWSSWKFWEGTFWTCRWNTVVVTYNCIKNKWNEFVSTFGECFDNIINSVADGLESGLRAFVDLIPKDCHDITSCWNALGNAISSLVDKVAEFACNIFKNLLAGLNDGLQYAQSLIPKIEALVQEIGQIIYDVGEAIVNFIVDSLKSIRSIMGCISMCSSDGIGWFSFSFTDCSTMSAMETLWGQIGWLWTIGPNFEEVVRRFLSCLTRSTILSLPTPFMTVDVVEYCLPVWMQMPIKGIVGAFIYFINQISAVAGGCTGTQAEEPLCKLVNDIGGIGAKLENTFNQRLSLAQTTADVTQEFNGSVSGGKVYREDCSGEDFKVFIDIFLTLKCPHPEGGWLSAKIGLELFGGCRDSQAFVDLILGIGFERGVMMADLFPSAAVSMGVGFDINRPQSILMKVSVYAKISITLNLKPYIPVAALGILIGLKLLPELKEPHGFKASVKLIGTTQPVSLVQGQIDDAARTANSPEEAMGSSMGLAIQGIARSDIGAMVDEAHPSIPDSMRYGSQSMKKAADDVKRAGAKADLLVSLEFKFCLTCHMTGADGPGWIVREGLCDLSDCGSCVHSPGYPSSYGDRQACKIEPIRPTGISISSFDTESGYDKLTVNGVNYDGTSGPSGVVPVGEISWSSDYSVTRNGWKMCYR